MICFFNLWFSAVDCEVSVCGSIGFYLSQSFFLFCRLMSFISLGPFLAIVSSNVFLAHFFSPLLLKFVGTC